MDQEHGRRRRTTILAAFRGRRVRLAPVQEVNPVCRVDRDDEAFRLGSNVRGRNTDRVEVQEALVGRCPASGIGRSSVAAHHRP